MRNLNLIGYLIVLIAASESSVIKRRALPSTDPTKVARPVGNGLPQNVPGVPGKDKNLRRPPFGDPTLADEDFGLYDDFDAGVPMFPPEYDYKNTADEDLDGKDSSTPGKIPEIHPDNNHGGYPDEEHDDEDETEEPNRDHGMGKPADHDSDEEGMDKDIDKPFDHSPDEHSDEDDIHKDIDESDYHGSGESFDAEEYTEKPISEEEEPDDEHADEDIDNDVDESPDHPENDEDIHKDIDESPSDSEDDEEAPDIDESVAESSSGGFVFETPYFNIRQVTKYFQQLEKALEQVFRQTMDEAVLLNNTYANTTEEEVEIDGKKYIVQKSIIKGRDNNSSIYVEALSQLPKTNETEEVKDSGI